ncbi:iron-containing alcohol dehydrogenase [Nakamurella leprariae]|uniref:Iron-containing alcohol dehydrogenase n=1 Tax=Nakamurella leprariae TaxID=2803911 RepID=A0A938Y6E4_9ACTN|nr:iron-containing alcohol dehydrogenase [Nakamurella leprariae]MBM9466635.1 iron-containing alcohol dehydrogenase [Nakamurella leprariae]
MTTALCLPRILRVGGGAAKELGPILAGNTWSRVVIVTDRYLESTGAAAAMAADLAGHGVTAEVFADTRPDPTTESLAPLVELLRAHQVDAVVGFGGGSPIDTAKAAAFLSSRPGEMREYKAPVINDGPSLPVVAIPTTAGSGSESTRFTIVTDSASDEKMLCTGMAFLPTVSLVDFELTMSMPARLTADTGVDALTHAIEAYVSRKANDFADAWALQAMTAISRHLVTAYRDPADRDARAAMMAAATRAGLAFSNASVCLVHGMSRPIGAHFHLAHGLSNAMLLPAVTAFSLSGAPARYADCARAMGVAAADADDVTAGQALVAGLRELNATLEVPTPASLGLDRDRWTSLAPLMAEQALASGSPGNNPRVPTAEEIVGLYAELWD